MPVWRSDFDSFAEYGPDSAAVSLVEKNGSSLVFIESIRNQNGTEQGDCHTNCDRTIELLHFGRLDCLAPSIVKSIAYRRCRAKSLHFGELIHVTEPLPRYLVGVTLSSTWVVPLAIKIKFCSTLLAQQYEEEFEGATRALNFSHISGLIFSHKDHVHHQAVFHLKNLGINAI